ncbi:hypothetical protein SK128_015230 [Halocaridina rubra]|uniref:G protein-coupled receptor n=1 Tax=Halocaridina rubra TaxID=373956 RepID=A0AAN9A7V3_HALRR
MSRYNNSTDVTVDNITRTLGIIFIVNSFLNAPHFLSHLLHARDAAYYTVHNIFHLQLAIDPLIFMGMNSDHRRAVAGGFRSCHSKCSDRDEEQFYISILSTAMI